MKRVFIATYIVAGLLVLGATGFSKLSDIARGWFSQTATAALDDLQNLPTRYEAMGRPIAYQFWNIPDALAIQVAEANEDATLVPFQGSNRRVADTVVLGINSWDEAREFPFLDEFPLAVERMPEAGEGFHMHSQALTASSEGEPIQQIIAIVVNLTNLAELPAGCDALFIHESILRVSDPRSTLSVPLSERLSPCIDDHEIRVGFLS